MSNSSWRPCWRPWPTRSFLTGRLVWGDRMRRYVMGRPQDRELTAAEDNEAFLTMDAY